MAHGFLRRIFEVFDRFETPVDVVSTSEVSVSLTIDSTANLESILTELKKSIEAELKDPAYIQPALFDDPEQERFERNKDAMRARAKEIPEEIKRETAAIRARFANPKARMFPVAVTFLVPERTAGGK